MSTATRTCAACGEEAPDGARFCPACGAPLATAARPESRRRVTILFSDLAGSTQLGERLDPETLRGIMTRYFDEMRAVIERHGGAVEKFIGDAVMAVFGIPVRREDDALRAVRAAAEMREAQEHLNAELEERFGVRLRVRTGVNTGEVVAGDASLGQSLVLGDAVNVAARLEQVAPENEVLIGAETEQLVRGHVAVEPVEPLVLKGKSLPLAAFRLVTAAAPPEAAAEPGFVGRERELALLRGAVERTARDRRSELLTVIGAPGIGKSRLVRELEAQLGDIRIEHGRCLSYGEGGPFWALGEVVRGAAGIRLGEAAGAAREKLSDLLRGAPDADAVARLVGALIGLDDRPYRPEEGVWAVRRLLAALSAGRPLVVVLDDLQWGEPAFLDLLEDLGAAAVDAPILLLCVARPELRELRPRMLERAASLTLEPLGEDRSRELAARLAGELAPDVAARIAAVAGGNPLFVTELLRSLLEEGRLERRGGMLSAVEPIESVPVPPTLEALLAARLERLASDERSVAESASVVGEEFRRDEVAQLAPDPVRPLLEPCLAALVRHEVIAAAGEEAFRFAHLLIRDVTYRGMLKQRRAELHERFADWLEARAGDRVGELEAILGYHLEQAFRYREALAPVGEPELRLARRACRHLTAAGQRALARVDRPSAMRLLARARDLLPPDDPDALEAGLELASARFEDFDLDGAVEDARAVIRAATDGGLPDLALRARLDAEWYVSWATPSAQRPGRAEVRQQAIERFSAIGDHRGLARAWRQVGISHYEEEQYAAATEALATAIEHARAAGDRRVERELGPWHFAAWLVWGPMPAHQAYELGRRRLDQLRGEPFDELHARAIFSIVCFMLARFEEGRELWRASERTIHELGLSREDAMFSGLVGMAETWSGDLARAERMMRRGYETVDEGGRWTVGTALAELLLHTGRAEEAEEIVARAEEAVIEWDLQVEVSRRAVKAQLLARRHEFAEAETLAREAVGLAEATDELNDRARVHAALADVLRAKGDAHASAAALAEAESFYERKGNVAALARLRERFGLSPAPEDR
jgi:class 3 adenylate cyclase